MYEPVCSPTEITIKFQNFWTPENCCNLPKIQTKRLNLMVFRQKDANGKHAKNWCSHDMACTRKQSLATHRLPWVY